MKLIFGSAGNLIATGDDNAASYEGITGFRIADSVDGVSELWRYSYDIEGDALVVAYPGMTDEDAMAQLEADAAAEAAAQADG